MLILIGGISRSGKTTLALKLQAEQYPNAVVLHQDQYIQPQALMPTIRDRIDWEHPASIHWSKWKSDILRHLSNNETLIAEGIFAFADADVNGWAVQKHLLSIDEVTFRQRKAEDHRWGYEPPWYIDHIWKSGLTYQNLGKIVSFHV